MHLDELSALFPSRNVIEGNALMIGPADIWRLEGRLVAGCRMFLIICNGCMDVRIDGRPYVLYRSMFVDMFEKTSFHFEHIAPDCEAYCFLPTQEFTSDAMMSFRVGNDRHLVNCMKFPVLRIPTDDLKVLERPLKLLSDSVHEVSHHYRKEMCQVYFRAFLVEFSNILFRVSDGCYEGAALLNRSDGLFMDFMKLVWQHACKEHRIDFYAGSLHISSKHLTRVVKEKLGDTPHEVIAKEIVHYAIEMLQQEERSIQQIAAILNFSDQASFCKFFKKQMQLSPTEYRLKNSVAR